jgi:hypothetical protein
MSDDNSRDRRPPRRGADGQAPDPKRTILGMPGVPRPGLSGRTPGEPDEPEPERALTATTRGLAPASNARDSVPDTRYMDPPSESLGGWPSSPDPLAFAAARTAESDARRFQPAGHEPHEPERASPYGVTEKVAVRPSGGVVSPGPEARPSPYAATAPEAWRVAARNVADKNKTIANGPVTSPKPPAPSRNPGSTMAAAARTSPGTRASAGSKGEFHSLRLKLDSEVEGYEEHYKGVPKSRLPAVLLGLLILLAAAGGGAYWAEEHGGLATLAARLHLTVGAEVEGPAPANAGPAAPAPLDNAAPSDKAAPAVTKAGEAQSPTGATLAAPPSAANPPPSAAAPSSAAAESARQPGASAQPTAAQDVAAQAIAEPDMPVAAPPSAAKVDKPAASAQADKPVAAPPAAARADKPAASAQADKPVAAPAKVEHHRPAAPAARPVVHHEPVVKIRDLGAAPGAPPEPAGSPYVPPVPIDPPAPDEPR